MGRKKLRPDYNAEKVLLVIDYSPSLADKVARSTSQETIEKSLVK